MPRCTSDFPLMTSFLVVGVAVWVATGVSRDQPGATGCAKESYLEGATGQIRYVLYIFWFGQYLCCHNLFLFVWPMYMLSHSFFWYFNLIIIKNVTHDRKYACLFSRVVVRMK